LAGDHLEVGRAFRWVRGGGRLGHRGRETVVGTAYRGRPWGEEEGQVRRAFRQASRMEVEDLQRQTAEVGKAVLRLGAGLTLDWRLLDLRRRMMR